MQTGKQKVIAIGVGALAGLTLLGGAAFAQTPGGSSTPSAQATATATAPADGSGGQQKDPSNCPHDQNGDQGNGSSSGSNSSYRGA